MSTYLRITIEAADDTPIVAEVREPVLPVGVRLNTVQIEQIVLVTARKAFWAATRALEEARSREEVPVG